MVVQFLTEVTESFQKSFVNLAILANVSINIHIIFGLGVLEIVPEVLGLVGSSECQNNIMRFGVVSEPGLGLIFLVVDGFNKACVNIEISF